MKPKSTPTVKAASLRIEAGASPRFSISLPQWITCERNQAQPGIVEMPPLGSAAFDRLLLRDKEIKNLNRFTGSYREGHTRVIVIQAQIELVNICNGRCQT